MWLGYDTLLGTRAWAFVTGRHRRAPHGKTDMPNGERHLRHVLLSYMKYHNEIRTHLSLEKDAPVSRAVKLAGTILCRPILGGLHHQYVRI
jgi:hypothetical protein